MCGVGVGEWGQGGGGGGRKVIVCPLATKANNILKLVYQKEDVALCLCLSLSLSVCLPVSLSLSLSLSLTHEGHPFLW